MNKLLKTAIEMALCVYHIKTGQQTKIFLYMS